MSLHYMVERLQGLLARADNVCLDIMTRHGPGHKSQTLAQLYQALRDGKSFVQLEYDRIVAHHSSRDIEGADCKSCRELS